jgi:cytochrome c peroxidase
MKVTAILSGFLLFVTIGWTAVSRSMLPGEVPVSAEEVFSVSSASPALLLKKEQELGRMLFFDQALSRPAGQSCASCHSPAHAFADPESTGVSAGAIKGLLGNRNTPSVAYARFTPPVQYDSTKKQYIGGLFWDGRANSLEEQASGPLLNHLEMNATKAHLLAQVYGSNKYDLVRQLYGLTDFNNQDSTTLNLSRAIAAFEASPEVNPFTSKFDLYVAGKTKLNKQELHGLKIFNDPEKGNCAACHPSTPDARTKKILFTDFTYDNIGVPANKEIKKLPKRNAAPDFGLGTVVKKNTENGKFKVPTLRNVALTAPYFHNGSIKTLEEVVRFYNKRNSGKFGKPEVPENVNQEELGNLRLTEKEMTDLVAFLKTLSDNYQLE